MALALNESFERGYVVCTDGSLAVTYVATGAAVRNGYLRDADGRLVVTNG